MIEGRITRDLELFGLHVLGRVELHQLLSLERAQGSQGLAVQERRRLSLR